MSKPKKKKIINIPTPGPNDPIDEHSGLVYGDLYSGEWNPWDIYSEGDKPADKIGTKKAKGGLIRGTGIAKKGFRLAKKY